MAICVVLKVYHRENNRWGQRRYKIKFLKIGAYQYIPHVSGWDLFLCLATTFIYIIYIYVGVMRSCSLGIVSRHTMPPVQERMKRHNDLRDKWQQPHLTAKSSDTVVCKMKFDLSRRRCVKKYFAALYFQQKNTAGCEPWQLYSITRKPSIGMYPHFTHCDDPGQAPSASFSLDYSRGRRAGMVKCFVPKSVKDADFLSTQTIFFCLVSTHVCVSVCVGVCWCDAACKRLYSLAWKSIRFFVVVFFWFFLVYFHSSLTFKICTTRHL